MRKRELSIFVDESGDFGSVDRNSPFYIVSLVFHEQSDEISPLINELDANLSVFPMKDHLIHSGPIIRNEENYFYLSLNQRRKVLNCLVSFARRAPIKYHSIAVDKRKYPDKVLLSQAISLGFKKLITNNFDYFQSFNTIKIYYDNGQTELTQAIITCFTMMLSNAMVKKVKPNNYKLFQVADLVCTISLIVEKEKEFGFSKSESIFFGNRRDFNKNYAKRISVKKID
nr:MAG TPA: Protein of unknown function (DUF3800) [Caudoviricetes sp.]